MASFARQFPDLAARETRTLVILDPDKDVEPGQYGFLELYCVDRKCDCRRALIEVRPAAEPERVLALINFGWESEDFYARWMRGDRESAREIAGASLDFLHPQSRYAPYFLNLFQTLLVPDRSYVERLARHYAMFKAVVRKGLLR